jgi:hypothetical protein
MKIEKWCAPGDQMAQLRTQEWTVSRLIMLAKDLDVFDMPLDHLNLYYSYDSLTLRQMVMHMNAVNDADLSYPIILDEDGELMDGRHRIMKALLNEHKTIKAVRFDKNPTPCKEDKNEH